MEHGSIKALVEKPHSIKQATENIGPPLRRGGSILFMVGGAFRYLYPPVDLFQQNQTGDLMGEGEF